MRATLLFDFGSGLSWTGNAHAKIYQTDPPLEGHEFVRVSKAVVPLTGPETYVFACSAEGEILDWRELEASRWGEYTHEEILEGAGYEVVYNANLP